MGIADLSPREREWAWAIIQAEENQCQYCREEINILSSAHPNNVSGSLVMTCDYCGEELLNISEDKFRDAYKIYSVGVHKDIIEDAQERLDNIMTDEEINEIKVELNRLLHFLDGPPTNTGSNPNRNKENSPKDKI